MTFLCCIFLLLGLAILGLCLAKKEGAYGRKKWGKVFIIISICGAYALTLGDVLEIKNASSLAEIEDLSITFNCVEWMIYGVISIFTVGFASVFFSSKLAQDEEKNQ